ncbi:MAG: alpha-glucosidase, partial [Anaerolineae bacterium]|nr:alpha-glucosidase [Anaerolineae bacterium]
MSIRPPKIVIVGAGSAIFGLGALSTMMQSRQLHGAHIALCDTNEDGLRTMTRLAEIMNEAWGTEATISSSTERRDLLPGADFVVVSIQVGQREDVWEKDWQIPLQHGVRQPYAENGGPGSFAHAARNLPVILAIARDMEELCPDAWYLNLVNPLIRLTT